MIPARERRKGKGPAMDQEVLEKLDKWNEISERAFEVLLMFEKVKHRQLAETFYKWYLRLVRERRELGLESDEAWKNLRR
jgi:hypothetical protein